MNAIIPMIGLRFGRWTVESFAGDRVHAHSQATRMYHCRCDCGVERDIGGGYLREGRTRSCGCLRRELKRERDRIAAARKRGTPCDLAAALGYPSGGR